MTIKVFNFSKISNNLGIRSESSQSESKIESPNFGVHVRGALISSYLSNDSAVKVSYYTVIVVVNVVIYDGLENTILDILVNNWFINNLNR